MERAGAIERHADDATLLGERLEDCLPDPPDGVGDELDPLRLVELVCGADQAEVALVDQVRERDALVLILLRDRHDEAEVRPNQLVQRLLIVRADALRQRDLLVARDQRVRADVAEILVERPFLVRRLPVRAGRASHTGTCFFIVPRLYTRRGVRRTPAGRRLLLISVPVLRAAAIELA